MGLRLLGWPQPHQQHDAAELVDFLQPRLVQPPPSGCWETRRSAAEGQLLHTTSPVSALKCILLTQDPEHPTPEVQELVHQWHAQRDLHAFTELPPWCFLQLPRFCYHAPGWPVKQSQAYLLPQRLKLPHFQRSDTLETSWVPYRVVAYIQHHGPTPTSGHYTVAAADAHQQHWLLDDEKTPVLMTSQQVDHLSANAYLVLLVQEPAALPPPQYLH